jgi:hypothetical protein
MKTMAASDAVNRFGEFPDLARREPVVTNNNRPADTLIPELFIDKAAGYDEWLAAKVGKTLRHVESGAAELHSHADALTSLDARIQAKCAGKAA